jgi:hypothetical protein
MKHTRIARDPELFDDSSRPIVIQLDQKQHLIDLIGHLLIQITTSISKPMTDQEGSDD